MKKASVLSSLSNAVRTLAMVPVVGLEPTRPRGQQILSLHRLPFRHTGMLKSIQYSPDKINPPGNILRFRVGSRPARMLQ